MSVKRILNLVLYQYEMKVWNGVQSPGTRKYKSRGIGHRCDYIFYVEIKCQLDATEVFIAKLVVRSTCFGHNFAHHQEFKFHTDGCCLWHMALWFTGRWSGVEL